MISVLVLLYFVEELQKIELAKYLLLYRLQEKNIPKILSVTWKQPNEQTEAVNISALSLIYIHPDLNHFHVWSTQRIYVGVRSVNR